MKSVTLDADTLSKSQFTPIRNYTNDQFDGGDLLLSHGTHVVIDETPFEQQEDGKMVISGNGEWMGMHNTQCVTAENNLRTLGKILTEQRIYYDYKYYTLPTRVDLPILILSNKPSRVFSVSVNLFIILTLSDSLPGFIHDILHHSTICLLQSAVTVHTTRLSAGGTTEGDHCANRRGNEQGEGDMEGEHIREYSQLWTTGQTLYRRMGRRIQLNI